MKPVIDPVSPLRKDPRGRSLDRIGALSVFLAALGARLFYIRQLRDTPLFHQLQLDPAYYVGWARRIAAGDWLSGDQLFEQSPLYAYILAGIFRLFGEGLMAPRLVQAVVGAGTCLLVFLIARRLMGRPAGLAAGLLAALYAPGIFYDGMLMKTSWAAFFTAAMTMALVQSEGGRRGVLFGAGVLLGLAALLRDNLILLSPLLALWLAVDAKVRGRLSSGWLRESLARIAWLAAGVILAVAPVTARNVAVTGEWVLLTSGGGEVFYIGNNPGADGQYSPPPFVRATSGLEHEDFRTEAERRLGRPLSRREASSYWLEEGANWITSNPGEFASLLGRKLLLFLNAYEQPDNQNFDHHRHFVPALRGLPTWAVLFPLSVAGLVLGSRGWKDQLPLWVVACGYAASVMLFFNFARFRMPLVPVLLVFAGGALASAPSLVSKPRRPILIFAVAAVALMALLVARLPLHHDALHQGQSDSQLAELLARAKRPAEARSHSDQGILRLESVYTDAGGSFGPERQVAPPGQPGRPPLGESYYAILMEACLTRSRLEGGAGDPVAALAWSARAAAAAPDSIVGRDALTGHAELLLSSGRISAALPPVLRARRADPAGLRPALVHAHVLHRTGRSREAVRIVQAALDANPDPARLDLADANYVLGLIFRDLGERARMRFHLRETLSLHPGHPRAERIRALLDEADESEGLLSLPTP